MTGHWPLAIRLEVLPGESLVRRFECAKESGFDAVELPGRYLATYRDELLADVNRLPLPVSSISLGFRHSLLSSSAEHRRICRADVADLLRLCRTIGASGLVMPPLLSSDCRDSYAPHGPGDASRDARDSLIVEQLQELATVAASQCVGLWIEPVNHNETDYMTTLDHAARISRRVNHPAIGVVADVFHMSIEASDAAAALQSAADQLAHVHIAHTDRTEPRRDTLLLEETFATLHAIRFRGSVAVEARTLSGDVELSLRRCASEMRQMMSESLRT